MPMLSLSCTLLQDAIGSWPGSMLHAAAGCHRMPFCIVTRMQDTIGCPGMLHAGTRNEPGVRALTLDSEAAVAEIVSPGSAHIKTIDS